MTQLPHGAGTGTAPQAPDPAPPKTGKPGAGADAFPDSYDGTSAAGGADDKPAGEAAGLAGGSDQSFAGSSEGYLLKIVYLPDMTRPMAVSVKPGFGTASLKPTLQNGWMLTGFDASADSKTTELLTALAPLITAVKTPGKAEGGAKGGAGGQTQGTGAPRPVLRPGLYAFNYDANGALTGLCAVTYFSEYGTTPASGLGACTQ